MKISGAVARYSGGAPMGFSFSRMQRLRQFTGVASDHFLGAGLLFAAFKGSLATHPIATRYRWVVVLVLIGVSMCQADAQSMPPVLNPTTYRAPAGRYELTDDP